MMQRMTPTALPDIADPRRGAILVCIAAMISLAVAMGVGRFAFTPLFPLMVRDGVLDAESGALLAASNYLGYLVGALVAARLTMAPGRLLAMGLAATVIVTAAVGWSSTVPAWALLRFIAGVLSAWTLIATSAWGLAWLAHLGRPHLAGAIFSGVGLGIAAAGAFCLVSARFDTFALTLWLELAALAALAVLLPLAVSWRLPAPPAAAAAPSSSPSPRASSSGTRGLVACYALFGFGYILPATYLPALARHFVDDPQVFGLAWPLFGSAAAVSTVLVASGLKHANRVRVWSTCHLVMALGVLLPVVWPTLGAIVASSVLVGGTFMVITMVGMQEARNRASANATLVLGRMTAGFAFGQLMGPVVSAAIGRIVPDQAGALNYALAASSTGLLASAFYLWHHEQRHHTTEQHP